MYEFLRKEGIVFCRGLIGDYDKKTNTFINATFFENGKWQEKNNVKPDIIYDKSTFNVNKSLLDLRDDIRKRNRFVNELKFSELLTDKWETYKTFIEFSPRTVLIEKTADKKKIQTLKSEKVILKPRFGAKGNGIIVCLKKEIDSVETSYIAQEFIETKSGISGIVSGPHDLRIMLKNEKPFHAFVRIPAPGKEVSNAAAGGKVVYVPLEKIPESAWSIVENVCRKLKRFKNKLFTIDLIFDDGGKPWILELNSHPGMTLEDAEVVNKEAYYNAFVEFFKEAIKD